MKNRERRSRYVRPSPFPVHHSTFAGGGEKSVVTKTRIHDLAAEFGVDSEQLMRLLAELGIHVRSHLSALDAGQVALVRARWERERRKRPETPAPASRRRAPKSPKRAAAAAAPAPANTKPKRRPRPPAEVAELEAAEEERQREAAATAVDQELRLTPTAIPGSGNRGRRTRPAG